MTLPMVNKRNLTQASLFACILLLSFAGHAEIHSQLELSHLSFVSEDFPDQQEKNFGFIGADLQSLQAEKDLFKINLNGKYASGNSVLSYLNVKEIYFTYFIDSTASVHIGRKINHWSKADEDWNLGLYQPQFRWNPLDVNHQGLLGIFYEKKQGAWSLNLFGTPFFVPDQGPNYEIKDGQFVASNPYFTPPPQNILFNNVLLPIDYNIIKPEFSEVFLQPGFGLQLAYQHEGWLANLSGTYKPSHQFAFGYKGLLVTNRVRIDILPETYYEKVVGLDIARTAEQSKVGLSFIYNEPETPKFDSSYNAPVLQANTTLAPYIGYDLEPIAFELAGLIIDNGEISEVGSEADPNRQALTQKYLYFRAYQLSASYRSLIGDNVKILSTLQWRESEKNLLKTLKLKNIFDINGPWKITLDVFLVETSEEASPVSNYRNLDQVWIGASYDF